MGKGLPGGAPCLPFTCMAPASECVELESPICWIIPCLIGSGFLYNRSSDTDYFPRHQKTTSWGSFLSNQPSLSRKSFHLFWTIFALGFSGLITRLWDYWEMDFGRCLVVCEKVLHCLLEVISDMRLPRFHSCWSPIQRKLLHWYFCGWFLSFIFQVCGVWWTVCLLVWMLKSLAVLLFQFQR